MEKEVNGKKFKQVAVVGHLYALTGERFAILAPYPVDPDSWQVNGQQRWVCVKTDPDKDLVEWWKEENEEAQIGYPSAFHFVTYAPSIEFCPEHWIWIEEKENNMLPYHYEPEEEPDVDPETDVPEPEGPEYDFSDEDYPFDNEDDLDDVDLLAEMNHNYYLDVMPRRERLY